MNKKEIIRELEEKFLEVKKGIGFKASLEEIDRIFTIKDYVLKNGFVSDDFASQILFRISEFYSRWTDYLHSLLMPHPQNFINMGEAKVLNKEEKAKAFDLIKKAMKFGSKNALVSITKNKNEQREMIESSIELWEKDFKPEIEKIIKKINEEWSKDENN